jgi:hypothetical protein
MADHTRHPSDGTLVRAVDGELSPRRNTTLERHLVICTACRARMARMESAAADVSRAYRHEDEPHVPGADALRARLAARMTRRSAEWDRSWRFRLAERYGILPRAALAATALVAIVAIAHTLRTRQESAQPDPPFGSIESAALPIRSVTPGATQPIGLDEICAGRATERPRIPAVVRLAILRDYHMEDVPPEDYELDYLITPELGGTADRRNLWPEPYGSRVWNARVKDGLEQLLPQLVCRGALDLTTAQEDIAADWIAAYKKYFHSDRPVETQASRWQDDDDAGRELQYVLVSATDWRWTPAPRLLSVARPMAR